MRLVTVFFCVWRLCILRGILQRSIPVGEYWENDHYTKEFETAGEAQHGTIA